MQHEPEKPPSLLEETRANFNLLYSLVSVATCMATPLTRTHMGVHALGWNALVAFVGLLLYAGAVESGDFNAYVVIWVAMATWHRLRADPREHSKWGGDVWFLPFIRDPMKARTVEPVVVFLAGALITPYSESIGNFLMLMVLPMSIRHGIEKQVRYREERAMRDARIEMTNRMDRFGQF